MAEVGGRLIGIFATNLAAMLAAAPPAVQSAGDDADVEGNEVAASASAADEALPIDVLNLGSRAWSSLRQDGIQTLGDLTRRTEQQLLAIDNIGPASLADIRAKLADRGLALGRPPRSPGPTLMRPSLPPALTLAGPTRPVRGAQSDSAQSDSSRSGANGQRRPSAAAEPAVAPVTPLRPARGRTEEVQPET